MVRTHEKYDRLIERCKGLPPTPTAVAHPCDESSLRGAVEAAELGLLTPILVGPRAKIEAVAKQCGKDISRYQVVDAPHSHASAEAAVRLMRDGKAEMLMKGSLHTDELMGAVVNRETGLRTARRISHCFVMDVPALDRAIIVTDAAVNMFPTLRGQGPHHPERDRPGPRAGLRAAQGGDPVGDGDDQPEGAVHHRSRRPVQDGGSRPDHRRHPRRPARAGQRHQSERGARSRRSIRRWRATRTS